MINTTHFFLKPILEILGTLKVIFIWHFWSKSDTIMIEVMLCLTIFIY